MVRYLRGPSRTLSGCKGFPGLTSWRSANLFNSPDGTPHVVENGDWSEDESDEKDPGNDAMDTDE